MSEIVPSLVASVDAVLAVLDAHGRVLFANAKLLALVPDATGRALDLLVPTEQRNHVRDAVERARECTVPVLLSAALATESGPVPLRLRFTQASPHVFVVGVEGVDPAPLARQAERAALSTMGELALGLAHEIRNPLNAAVLQLHLLSRNVDRDVPDQARRSAMRDRVQIVVGEIRRLGRLLGDFLDLARPRPVSFQSVDLGAVLDEVVELHREEASQRGVTVVRAPDERTENVRGDPEKLRQVVVNLVINAIEATPTGGTVRILSRAEAGRLAIEVEDSGIGIAEGDLRRIFDPFFTTKPAGTGLGLAIVRKLVEQHGGSVSVRSVPSVGTTVRVVLPVG